ncbi:hypothetical protein [Actinophytocola oryzae]|uniref:LytR cell envelope-related transcriptional attenuator n=1 Tax=Actinophytocola oryzae TaxID=502181 RepID=A0A4R7W2C1_9PSEU|nr:hypothetical protein [Actinophytocola oryzae]TDV56158.1 hypothetical protein CLV71_102224 [Actinophytocola oryzae]
MNLKNHATIRPASALTKFGTRLLVATVAGAAFAVAGCSSPTEQPTVPTPSSTARQSVAATELADAPAPAVTTNSAPVAAESDFPAAVDPSALEHGGTYWGVYVTVVRADDNGQVSPADQKRLDAARKSLTDLGYQPDSGVYDNGCEQGVQEQLHLDPQRTYAAVRIYFATQTQAEKFVEEYQPGVVGTAKVTLYCMD